MRERPLQLTNPIRHVVTIWETHPLHPVPPRLYIAGVGLLLAYAFMKIAFYDEFKLLEPFLIAVGLYTFFRYGLQLRTSLPVLLFFSSIIIATIVWIAAHLHHPDLVRSSPSPLHLGRHFVFIAFAFWISGHVRNSQIFFALALLGLFLLPWSQGGGFAELLVAIDGQRVNYGLGWQHAGVLFGIATLALIVFFPRITGFPNFYVSRFLVWLGFFTFSIFSIFATQTRSVFLALFLIFIIAASYFILRLLQLRAKPTLVASYARRFPSIVLLLFVLFLSLGVVSQMGLVDRIADRYTQEIMALYQPQTGDVDTWTVSSIGARVVSWRAGIEWFAERPLLGWGPNGGAIVMQNTPWITHPYLLGFGHMHSSYLEILVRYGLLGLSVYVVLFLWVTFYSFRAWKAGVLPTDFYLFFFFFFIYWSVVNIFESYMFYYTGVYAFNVVMAGLVSFIWKYQVTTKKKAPLQILE